MDLEAQEQNKKISIIIPYYETLKLTKNLLNEINHQRGKQSPIELILIDDGSNGKDLINDVDIYIRNNTNMGGAHSRNLGIDIASGDFILFIDCDDSILENYIFTVLEESKNNNDLTWISWTSIYGDAIVKSIEQPNIAPWGCLFKKEIFNNIRFNDKLNIGEEPEFWEQVFKIPNLKIGYTTNMIYYYNIREDSATRRFNRGELSKERK